MDQFPRAVLAAWASDHREVIALLVFGSRARGNARINSDLDLALELDGSWETPETVLNANGERWKKELTELTGLLVKDLHLASEHYVMRDVVAEVFRRPAR
jgi:predicted nucleotidyltransferase